MDITQYEQEAREYSAELLSNMNFESLAESVERSTITLPLGETAFKAIILPGESEDAALIFPGEFGNGRKAYGAIARAEVARAYMRSYADIDPSVIVLPNTTLGENNVGFTLEERKQIVDGSCAPLVDRMNVATQYAIGDQSGALTVGALSQGTYPGARFAAERDEVAIGIVEAPNVIARSFPQLGKAFLTSGKRLKETISANFTERDMLGKELLRDLGITSQMRYLFGAVKEDNRSLISLMARGGIEEDIQATLDRGGSVVQVCSSDSALSPEDANRNIAHTFENYLRYDSVIGRDGDHSMTNDYAFIAAILRRADELRNLPDES